MLENPFKPHTPIEKTDPEANRKLVETLLGAGAAEQYAKLDEGRVGKRVDDHSDLTLTDEERNILDEAREKAVWDREKYISWAMSLGRDEQWVTDTFTFNADGTVECLNLSLTNIAELKEFPSELKIKNHLDLESLTSADGLILPTSIGGGLYLNRLISADGLILPTSIGGYLDLRSLISANNLTLPTSIGRDLYLTSLTSADGLTLPTSIGGTLYLNRLTSADGLTLPTSIGGGLYLYSLISADGLILPTSIGGDLCLDRLTSADGLIVPDDFEIIGNVYIQKPLKPLFERLHAEGKIKGNIRVV